MEACQRDERNRNGHERLPKSRIWEMSKKLEHQLLKVKQRESGQEGHAVKMFLKEPGRAKCPEKERNQTFRELNSRCER